MKKQLHFCCLSLAIFIGSWGIGFAQSSKVSGNGSRLDIGKKKATVKTAINWQTAKTLNHLPLSNRFFVSEIRYRKPDAINQYFRTSLLQNKVSKPMPTPVELSSEKQVESFSTEKLFASEKINVSNVYPNPASDYAMVDYNITGNLNEAKLVVYNLLGSQIAEYDLDRLDRNLRISTANLASGIYLYQLSVDGQKVMTKKFLVRHQ